MKLRHIAALGGIAALGLIACATHLTTPGLYPDARFTTGVIATSKASDLTAVYSGSKTYSQSHRDVSVATKKAVLAEYGIEKPAPGAYEIDHFVPVALGGSNDIKNLWPEPAHVLVNGKDYGFHTKDKLEAYLVIRVKAGAVQPTDAQQCIIKDWVACYEKYLGDPNKLGAAFQEEDNDDGL